MTENYFKNYPEVEIIGYLNGYKGLLLGKSINFPKNIINNIKNIYVAFGGTPIGNSRVKLTNVADCISNGYIQNGEVPLDIAAKHAL